MTRTSTPPRAGQGWQLILADLALILFMLALSALPAAESEKGRRLADDKARKKDALGTAQLMVAPAQALYRPLSGGPSLGAWLDAQAPDPRATLTIFATHTQGEEAAAWAQAEALAAEARARGAQVRTIITVGPAPDVYASLAYDTVIAKHEDAGDTS